MSPKQDNEIDDKEADVSEFERSNEQPQPSLVAEFIDFLKHNKKWWLTPILIVLAGLGILVAFSNSAAAPFIYTTFLPQWLKGSVRTI